VISKTIVEAYGGEISFESKDGEGTTFTFTFALQQQPELEQFRNQLIEGIVDFVPHE
jgi:signal transduction histidine kinase